MIRRDEFVPPVMNKPHIYKTKLLPYPRSKNRQWRCYFLDKNGDFFSHVATSPVYAYRGVMRKINAAPILRTMGRIKSL